MSDLPLVLGLFLNAFLSATLLPGASEAALAGMVATGAGGEPWLLVLVAGAGNTLGSVANWAAGRLLFAFREHRWFPARPASVERAGRLFSRYGLAVLLLAWLPVVGDALTVAAGLLRVPLLLFVPIVGLGKLARYALVAAGASALS